MQHLALLVLLRISGSRCVARLAFGPFENSRLGVMLFKPPLGEFVEDATWARFGASGFGPALVQETRKLSSRVQVRPGGGSFKPLLVL